MVTKKAQLLSNYIDVTESLTGRLAFSAISPLLVDRFGRSLRSYHLEFDNEAIDDGFMPHSRVLGVRGGGRLNVILES